MDKPAVYAEGPLAYKVPPVQGKVEPVVLELRHADCRSDERLGKRRTRQDKDEIDDWPDEIRNAQPAETPLEPCAVARRISVCRQVETRQKETRHGQATHLRQKIPEARQPILVPEVIDDNLKAEPHSQQVKSYVFLLQSDAIIAQHAETTTPQRKVETLSKYTDQSVAPGTNLAEHVICL